MTNAKDFPDKDFRNSLPADLQELDRELSGIRIEERPSFGPELEAELVRAWRARPAETRRDSGSWVRGLMVAGLAGLLVVGVGVPPARAAVARVVQSIVSSLSGLPEAAPEPQLPVVEVSDPSREITNLEASSQSSLAAPASVEDQPFVEEEASILPEVHITFPALVSRHEAESLIASFYPLALQRAGVGGSVKLQFWVNENGMAENVQMREGSGYRSLNWAALRAARELRFEPATRNGRPVGTWVEFYVHFVPGSGVGIVGLDPAGSEGIGGS